LIIINIKTEVAIELDKIVKIMNEYPKMGVFVGAYTDCQGSSDYNMTLSENRAKSVIAYIMSKGITSNRISGRGYGELKQAIKCECDGDIKLPCTNEMQILNRRVEFTIVKM